MSTDQAKPLRTVIGERRPDLLPLVTRALDGIRLSIDEASEIRETIGHELAETGVDPQTGAVNERGAALDALIDYVASKSALHD